MARIEFGPTGGQSVNGDLAKAIPFRERFLLLIRTSKQPLQLNRKSSVRMGRRHRTNVIRPIRGFEPKWDHIPRVCPAVTCRFSGERPGQRKS